VAQPTRLFQVLSWSLLRCLKWAGTPTSEPCHSVPVEFIPSSKLGKGNEVLESKLGQQYLDYAIRLDSETDKCCNPNYNNVKVLLEHGADPNYESVTAIGPLPSAWTKVLETVLRITKGNCMYRIQPSKSG
jgi:hypothetical protein